MFFEENNGNVCLKGKQVRILYDLVTVFKEYKTSVCCTVTGEPGRRLICRFISQETCLLLVREHEVPDHE